MVTWLNGNMCVKREKQSHFLFSETMFLYQEQLLERKSR